MVGSPYLHADTQFGIRRQVLTDLVLASKRCGACYEYQDGNTSCFCAHIIVVLTAVHRAVFQKIRRVES